MPSSGQITARKGGAVTLECKASGNPVPQVTWVNILKCILQNDFKLFTLKIFQTKKSGTGKSAQRIGEGPILTLERVERQQSGVYQCSADNGVGEAATVDMRLDVLCKLMKKKLMLNCKLFYRKPQKPQFIIVHASEHIQILCRVPHMLITFDFQSVWLSLKICISLYHDICVHAHCILYS